MGKGFAEIGSLPPPLSLERYLFPTYWSTTFQPKQTNRNTIFGRDNVTFLSSVTYNHTGLRWTLRFTNIHALCKSQPLVAYKARQKLNAGYGSPEIAVYKVAWVHSLLHLGKIRYCTAWGTGGTNCNTKCPQHIDNMVINIAILFINS